MRLQVQQDPTRKLARTRLEAGDTEAYSKCERRKRKANQSPAGSHAQHARPYARTRDMHRNSTCSLPHYVFRFLASAYMPLRAATNFCAGVLNGCVRERNERRACL
eukprot:6214817-Pleurochrysis_carterae.AAC.1